MNGSVGENTGRGSIKLSIEGWCIHKTALILKKSGGERGSENDIG